MIYIFIVDDHPLFIDGVSSAFIKDIDNIEVIGSANSGKEAIEKLKDSKADVVLLDLVMPEMGGYECSEILKKIYPSKKIIILTGETDTSSLYKVWMNGVDAIELKYCGKQALVSTIREVMAGKRIIGQKVPYFFDNIETTSGRNAPNLTKREEEVLKLLATGNTRKEVADKLFLSIDAVHFHCKNLFKKFNKNRIHLLLAEARKYKIIS
jgi:DNA-binding NarL/FixJ family response regulator